MHTWKTDVQPNNSEKDKTQEQNTSFYIESFRIKLLHSGISRVFQMLVYQFRHPKQVPKLNEN